jgi:hypothetical protein
VGAWLTAGDRHDQEELLKFMQSLSMTSERLLLSGERCVMDVIFVTLVV